MCEFGIVKSPLEDFIKGRNVTIALVIYTKMKYGENGHREN